jgi:hypothetical protein
MKIKNNYFFMETLPKTLIIITIFLTALIDIHYAIMTTLLSILVNLWFLNDNIIYEHNDCGKFENLKKKKNEKESF